MKLDPSGKLLQQIHRLEQSGALAFQPGGALRIGVHTCPGRICDSTHSADVDYAELLPSLFQLKARNFYIALACEQDRAAC